MRLTNQQKFFRDLNGTFDQLNSNEEHFKLGDRHKYDPRVDLVFYIYSHFKISAGEVLQILRLLKSTIKNARSKARAVTKTNNNMLI